MLLRNQVRVKETLKRLRFTNRHCQARLTHTILTVGRIRRDGYSVGPGLLGSVVTIDDVIKTLGRLGLAKIHIKYSCVELYARRNVSTNLMLSKPYHRKGGCTRLM